MDPYGGKGSRAVMASMSALQFMQAKLHNGDKSGTAQGVLGAGPGWQCVLLSTISSSILCYH